MRGRPAAVPKHSVILTHLSAPVPCDVTINWHRVILSHVFPPRKFRLENSVIAQARMEKVFNEKEAARKEREWRQRGVWTDEMPNPLLPIV